MRTIPVLLLAGALIGAADPEADPETGPEREPTAADDSVPGDVESLREEVKALKDKVEELDARVKQSETRFVPDVFVKIGGYVDFGFFVPQADGVGFVQDYGNAQFPRYAGKYAWVFLGDILSTSVNSRGEAASLGHPPGVTRFDSVNSKGAPGFILNEANVTLRVGLHHHAILTTSLNFVPRSGSDFALGDFFDLDLAQLEWVASDAPEDPKLSFFVGKIDPVFGIEYKQRKANQRFGITPSLAQRYTSGTQLGLKARTKLLGDALILAAAVTNGSSTTEQFHFHDEVDSNAGKTVTGRAALHLPLDGILGELGGALEIGASGEWGAQDRATDNEGKMWFVGADLEYARSDFAIRAEVLKGRAPGSPIENVYRLELNGAAYIEMTYMLLEWLGFLARGELRDAFVSLGSERAYLTKSWRFTGGGRVVINENLLVKAEYLHNGEYGGIPQIKNDVFTSSFLVTY
jgi:hypothetical protein